MVGELRWTAPYFLGIVWGYLWYDFLHWSTHHRTPLTAWGKALRAHHMAHHFARPDRNFGISHRWVDMLVGSGGRRQSRRNEEELGSMEHPQA
jgi:sterol desaturase/sphingolipid hydroxylase (fatty acid hydroxylase superfamily)